MNGPTGKKFSLFIGRYQPFHDGHEALIRRVLAEGKNVCIALRDTGYTETDPYSINERLVMIIDRFEQEIFDGRVVTCVLPDIEEVCYGRKVGWGIREIRLDPSVEGISATEIRSKGIEE